MGRAALVVERLLGLLGGSALAGNLGMNALEDLLIEIDDFGGGLVEGDA